MNDKVSIITGASRGIGAETAKLLAQKGSKVVINYAHSSVAAEEVVSEIKENGGEAFAIQADARDITEMQKLVEETINKYGKIDVFVHNVGMNFPKKTFENIEWDEFIQKTNDELEAAFISTKLILPHMKKQNYGKLVYVSSGLSNHPAPNFIAHGTSKSGLNSFVRYIAQEVGKYGITANIVSPGLVETDATKDLPKEFKEKQESALPLGRLGRPSDIAKTIAFYTSDDSGYITGSYTPVSGGGEMN